MAERQTTQRRLRWLVGVRELLYRVFMACFVVTLVGSFAIALYCGQSKAVLWERPGYLFSTTGFSCMAASLLLFLLTQRAIGYVGELDRSAKATNTKPLGGSRTDDG